MKRSLLIGFVWGAVTFGAMAVAWTAVTAADSLVAGPGIKALSVAEVAALPTTTVVSKPPSGTNDPPSEGDGGIMPPAVAIPDTGDSKPPPTDAMPSATATTTPSTPSTPTPSSTTTTTVPPTTSTTSPPPTTTTTAPTQYQTQWFHLVGGSVKVRWNSREVWLDGTQPTLGYHVEVKSAGPGRVEVEFESDPHDSKFTAKTSAGALVHEIEEEDED